MDMWGADAPCKAYKEKSCRESADELAVHFHVACWDYPHAIAGLLRYTRIRSWSLDDRSPWQNLGQTLSSHERPSPEPPAGRRPLRPGFKRVYVMNDLESERIHSNVDVCAANLQYCNGTEYVGQGGDRPRYTAHLLYHVGSSYYTYGRNALLTGETSSMCFAACFAPSRGEPSPILQVSSACRLDHDSTDRSGSYL